MGHISDFSNTPYVERKKVTWKVYIVARSFRMCIVELLLMFNAHTRDGSFEGLKCLTIRIFEGDHKLRRQ
jgi:hypothetical protein